MERTSQPAPQHQESCEGRRAGAVMSRALSASWVLIPCPTCDGEGCTVQLEVGGYFDLKQECWYPWEKVVRCSECGGNGRIEVTYDLDEQESPGQEGKWREAA